MRTMIMVELDTETANKEILDGSMAKTMEEMLGRLKPEAAYFFPHNGHRNMTLVVDMPDESSLVTFCEPLWERNAKIEVCTCMNADDLRNGLSHLR